MPRAAGSLKLRVHSRLKEQRLLVQSLLRLRKQLQGSLFTRYGRCGKTGCACREGQPHGPYYVLSNRSGGAGSFAYLDKAQVGRVRDLVRRHREFRSGLRRLQRLNRELDTLLRRYQEATIQDAHRSLALGKRT